MPDLADATDMPLEVQDELDKGGKAKGAAVRWRLFL